MKKKFKKNMRTMKTKYTRGCEEYRGGVSLAPGLRPASAAPFLCTDAELICACFQREMHRFAVSMSVGREPTFHTTSVIVTGEGKEKQKSDPSQPKQEQQQLSKRRGRTTVKD